MKKFPKEKMDYRWDFGLALFYLLVIVAFVLFLVKGGGGGALPGQK